MIATARGARGARGARRADLARIALVVLLAGCSPITNPFADEGRLTRIEVSGDTLVAVGDTIRLSARGTVGGIIGMLSYDRVLDAAWTVSDAATASYTPVVLTPSDSTSGSTIRLTGLRAGDVQVSASARGVRGAVTVHVTAAP